MRIHITRHAIERGMKRFGDAWAVETSRDVPFESWLRERIEPAIRAYGFPPAGRAAMVVFDDMRLCVRRADGDTVSVITLLRRSASNCIRKSRSRDRRKGRPFEQRSVDAELREWGVRE